MNTTTNNPSAAPAPKSLREQWNERMGQNLVDQAFEAIDVVRRYTKIVTIIAMLVSFFHQRNFFDSLGAGWFAWFLPLTLDAVTLALMKVSSLRIVKAENRKKARRAMLVPAVASMVVNGLADGHPILRGFYVFVVVAILIGEYAESLIVPDFDEFEKEIKERSAAEASTRKLDPEVASARAAKARETRARNTAARQARAAKAAATRKAKGEKGDTKAAAGSVEPAAQVALEIPGLDTVQALNNGHRLQVVSRRTR